MFSIFSSLHFINTAKRKQTAKLLFGTSLSVFFFIMSFEGRHHFPGNHKTGFLNRLKKLCSGYFPGNPENFLFTFSFGYGIKKSRESSDNNPLPKRSSLQSISREIQITEEKSPPVLLFTVFLCQRIWLVPYPEHFPLSAPPVLFLPVLPCDGRGLPLHAESTAAPLQIQSKAACCKPNQTRR